MSLYTKLHAVMSECPYIQKDKKNSVQNYSYLSEAAIKARIGSALCRQGVLFLPTGSRFVGSERITTSKGGEEIIQNIELSYKFLDVETGEEHHGTMLGSGSDRADKGVYKAITGAIKYILTATFLIETGEDPEAEAAPPPATKEEAKAAQKQVLEQKLAAPPAQNILMPPEKFTPFLEKATANQVNIALADVGNRLDAKTGKVEADLIRIHHLTQLGVGKSSELDLAGKKKLLQALYNELTGSVTKAEEEVLDWNFYRSEIGRDLRATVNVFQSLKHRLTQSMGGNEIEADKVYRRALERQGVKHANEFKGAGMDAKARLAAEDLYQSVMNEEAALAEV